MGIKGLWGVRIVAIVFLFSLILFCGCSDNGHKVVLQQYNVDVVDVRGETLERLLLITSLQGLVNRDQPRLYLIWESRSMSPTPSEHWLDYYRSKGWIKDTEITYDEALQKYKDFADGVVVWDDSLYATVNLAEGLAATQNLVIAHQSLLPLLQSMGYTVVEDLRGKFSDTLEVHQEIINSVLSKATKDVIYNLPTEDRYAVLYRMALLDYAVSVRACSFGLRVDVSDQKTLLEQIFDHLNRFAVLVGYCSPASLERPTVEFCSQHEVVTMIGSFMAFNFSFHRHIGKRSSLKQDHITSYPIDTNKIYIALCLSDLGLNSMQSLYYEMWKDDDRGEIKLSWWMNPLVLDFCPGIAAYYYETKAAGDYFYAAHAAGRIRPSDFPSLSEYLQRSRDGLLRTDLKIVCFSDHTDKNPSVLQAYTDNLGDIALGFSLGFGPLSGDVFDPYWFIGDELWVSPQVGPATDYDSVFNQLKQYIDSHTDRPLFIPVCVGIFDWITMDDLIRVRNDIDALYPGEIEWVRADELLAAIREYENR